MEQPNHIQDDSHGLKRSKIIIVLYHLPHFAEYLFILAFKMKQNHPIRDSSNISISDLKLEAKGPHRSPEEPVQVNEYI